MIALPYQLLEIHDFPFNYLSSTNVSSSSLSANSGLKCDQFKGGTGPGYTGGTTIFPGGTTGCPVSSGCSGSTTGGSCGI